MCPVVLLALLFSFLLLLLELTAAINVTFYPAAVKKLMEDEEQRIYFSINSEKSDSHPDERFYKAISYNPDIASVTNETYFNTKSSNGTFTVRGNFLGKTEIFLQKVVNGTAKDNPKDSSNSLKVSVVRRVKAISHAFTASVAILVSLNYINMGCALDLCVVQSVLRKPIAPAIGFISQYAAMPLVAYGLARLLFDDVILQLGLFTFGCSPGGGASNMWTVLLNGNLNLSLTMTFISNLAALGMMPLWLFTLGRSLFSEIATEVPVKNILLSLVSMLIPLGIGLCFQKWLPRVARFCRRILAPVSVFMILFIIAFGTYANLYMFKLFTWRIVVAASANVWLGFLFGTIISKAFDLSLPDIITVAVETGVQNTGIAIVLLGFSLGQPEADLAAVVPVAASIMTPFPLLCVYLFLRVRNLYFPTIQESRLYVMDDEEEKKTLPSLDSSSSVMSSKVL
ncbi:LOW QUALITY PROTEIN: hepatic sodium/bile acid cotransporter-like [Uloborus diversus]|uniref:LOW QUALITY PROTEIN: hepatic sodium/bile acid cotransporter-like n=1 Tax=Uloborus diversus TaxID=327109 RepID=UPI00240997F0|nr:LOW QUALITY PROTEIN: hepatic sodium/bile acid cotransporter-like [Uloborus diversus]